MDVRWISAVSEATLISSICKKNDISTKNVRRLSKGDVKLIETFNLT